MKEKVKNGHNFNVDLSLPRKFWLHQSYGLRRPLATSFSISDLNMALAMFTKLLLGSRLENLFILTHISSEDIVFNSFFLFVIVFISCVRYLRSGWWLFQTTATRHLHCDSLFPRLPALHQHCYSRTSWGHTGAFALWLRTLHVLQRLFQTNMLSPGVNFFFLLLNRWIFIWNQLQNTTTKWSHTTARGTCRLLRPRQSWAPDETRTIFRCHTYMHTLTYSTL